MYKCLLGKSAWYFGFKQVSSARDIVAGVLLDAAVPLEPDWIPLLSLGCARAPTSGSAGLTRVQLRFEERDNVGTVPANGVTPDAIRQLANLAYGLASTSNSVEVKDDAAATEASRSPLFFDFSTAHAAVEFCIGLRQRVLELDREQRCDAGVQEIAVLLQPARPLVQLACHIGERVWFERLAAHTQVLEAIEIIVSSTALYEAQTLWEPSERLRVLYRGCTIFEEHTDVHEECHLFAVVAAEEGSKPHDSRLQPRAEHDSFELCCDERFANGNSRQVNEAVTPDDLGSLLGLAVQRGHLEATACLIAYARARRFELPGFLNERARPLLHIAVRARNPSMMRLLISMKAQLDARDDEGSAALHWACATNAIDSATSLLEAGCDVNTRDASGRTALHLASCLHTDEMVALLLSHRGSPCCTDNDGNTPLHRAAISRNGLSV